MDSSGGGKGDSWSDSQSGPSPNKKLKVIEDGDQDGQGVMEVQVGTGSLEDFTSATHAPTNSTSLMMDISEDEDREEEVVASDGEEEEEDFFPSDSEVEEIYFEEPPQGDYDVLDTSGIVAIMDKMIKDAAKGLLMENDLTTVRVLLTAYDWNQEELIALKDKKDQMLIKAGLQLSSEITAVPSESNSSAKLECSICADEFLSADSMHGEICGHRYCKTCWSGYLSSKIKDGTGPMFTCPDLKCTITVAPETAEKLVTDPKVIEMYRKLQMNYFMCKANVKWCPAPDCSRAIKIFDIKATPFYQGVECKCGSMWCFDCCSTDHNPVSCDMLKRWLKKCEDDSETTKWLLANTKDCPKCKTAIEKNGGCNHMTCKKLGCRYEFCWICLGDWKAHRDDGYNCNRYNNTSIQDADKVRSSRASLQRYLHYYARYIVNQQSQKLEEKLIPLMKVKATSLENTTTLTWIETQFLMKAAHILNRARQVLMYTFVFSFYLKENNHSLIFEGNQADLERSTELLSEYLEQELDVHLENPHAMKKTIEDRSNYCKRRIQVMLDHVKEGFQNQPCSWDIKTVSDE